MSRASVVCATDVSKVHVSTKGEPLLALHEVNFAVERNEFFSIPVSIIRTRAELPPPLPGQPGPFSLGAPGVLVDELEQAGFTSVEVRTIEAPLRLSSVDEAMRFERESFGALHTMLSGLDETGREAAWAEIASRLSAFDTGDGWVGPCELHVGMGVC